MSFSEIKDVLDDILSKSEKCQEDVKFAAGYVAISMKHVSHSDGNDNVFLEIHQTSSGANDLPAQMTQIAH